MNWHIRYAQQANWTRDLRSYIFEKTNLQDTKRVLEVGCGTGAILAELPQEPEIHGLDIDKAALTESSVHAPHASLVLGDATDLPYPDQTFDIVYCHYLLLWVRDPLRALQEMKRVIQTGGYVIAFAEPDYHDRIDKPEGLKSLGTWQTEALIRQGADPGIGARLAQLFFEAGIKMIETGTIHSRRNELSLQDWENEWEVLESDIASIVPDQEIQKMKALDKQAREQGKRVLHVPTYFAWGRRFA